MNAFFQELFRTNVYKKSQGRITRQATLATVAVIVALGAWRFHQTIISPPKFLANWLGGELAWWPAVYWGLPFVVAAALWWAAFRLINIPRFADFLIAVEAEMNKVSWPTWGELVRSSIVVLLTIFILAAVLLAFDSIWTVLFRWIGILQSAA